MVMESLTACLHPAPRKPMLVGVEYPSNQRCSRQIIRAGLTDISIQEEVIRKELQKENERLARQAEEEAAEKQRANDKARKEMREWWTQKWEAKKRSEGWGGYEKCWVLRAAVTAEPDKVAVISGEGVLVGAAPLVSGSIKPFLVDYPMVSSVHAHVYGRDVVKGYKKYVREYFVVDLGSTNGTYLNRSKLRPRTEVRLSSGDALKFGDERAIFVVESQK
ncbi:hypothetical protein GOP47_0006053 [Adiantum capillus-veneris]|uniref:FHA domain-containing protein n=1 Tax=Adiantum capillus-veneris TaxID=13818 RepID=A0A9D4ZLN8_ADICA|nr:hypothetical protein GOP47_0006053 [Adiantum capillus-veneris]